MLQAESKSYMSWPIATHSEDPTVLTPLIKADVLMDSHLVRPTDHGRQTHTATPRPSPATPSVHSIAGPRYTEIEIQPAPPMRASSFSFSTVVEVGTISGRPVGVSQRLAAAAVADATGTERSRLSSRATAEATPEGSASPVRVNGLQGARRRNGRPELARHAEGSGDQ